MEGGALIPILLLATVFGGMTVALWLVIMGDQKRLREQVLQMLHAKSPTKPVLTPQARQELERTAAERLSKEVDASAKKLAGDLRAAGTRIGGQLDKMTTAAVTAELTEYRKVLADNRARTNQSLGQARAEIEKRHQQVQSELDRDVEAEKRQLMQTFESRVGDVFSAYVADSLGNDADLGAQTKYVLQALEADKDQLKKDIARG